MIVHKSAPEHGQRRDPDKRCDSKKRRDLDKSRDPKNCLNIKHPGPSLWGDDERKVLSLNDGS